MLWHFFFIFFKQIVMKENKKDEKGITENLESIQLNISGEEMNKINSVESNFVLIEELLKKLSGDSNLFEKCNEMILEKLGYNKNEFVSQLVEEMSKIMWDLDFKCMLNL
ncbi:unnamed protein product [Meloidogyne enterolobii]|uniref:Uncharacterized protein n=1 Tax=Meloidogyne enterolobii TaxID=390850 RepID=A0ACB1AAQ5_MELEN